MTVIVATRDRPALLARALRSVRAQTLADFALIVVDDGSAPEAAAAIATLAREFGESCRLCALPPVAGGHGPSFSRNFGAAQAESEFLAFLDDDDEWIDPAYLARACAAFAANADAGILYANQESLRPDGTLWPPPVWIEALAAIASRAGPPQPDGTYRVTPAQVMQTDRFAHLNATIVRRSLFEALDGFDRGLRYEEDRDFQLRALDACPIILHYPATVARHHVPRRGTASTALGPEARVLDQLRLLDKALLGAARPEIRAYASRHKAYTLKTLARHREAAGDFEIASLYAREALALAPSPKWLAWSAALAVKRRLRRGPSSP